MFGPGQRVGEYELVRSVAAGGMAHVFVARRPGAEQPIAVKVIHEHLSEDWQAMRWFVDEALISIRIQHPNVVRVDELGEQDGLYYLAMEYVHGCSLAQLMVLLGKRGRRLDPWLSAWIAARVAEGLHAAHELTGDDGERLGVIHRDVSPQNILLSALGEVKLTDFGIAKAQGRATRTQAGELRGKFRYMAPEQVVEKRGQDHRVDVFTLGVVLWELLTQKRLYARMGHMELLERLREPQIARPSSIRPDIPASLDGIVMNAVASNKDERPQTAAVLQQELDEALTGAIARGEAPSDPKVALSDVLLECFGRELHEAARALPEDLAKAIGVESFEPTNPRALATATSPVDPNDPSGPVALADLEADAALAAQPTPAPKREPTVRTREERRVAREQAERAASKGWMMLVVLLGGLLVALGAAAWLLLD